MKVGIIISFWPTHDPDSGIGNNYHRLACSLAERGHEVTVFHINPQKPSWQRGDSHRESGFEVIEIPCRVLPDKNWIGWFSASHDWKTRSSATRRIAARIPRPTAT